LTLKRLDSIMKLDQKSKVKKKGLFSAPKSACRR
jgi:hypothetical protein